MISIDTNILLRYTLNDNPKLSQRAREIIESNTCHVPMLALAEFGFVLGSFYEAKPAEIVRSTRALMQLKTLRFELESRVLQALAGVEAGIDWFDALLWAATPVQNELATLDKKFANKAIKLGWQPPVTSMLAT
jgi:predicted nucleic acid-binding protein